MEAILKTVDFPLGEMDRPWRLCAKEGGRLIVFYRLLRQLCQGARVGEGSYFPVDDFPRLALLESLFLLLLIDEIEIISNVQSINPFLPVSGILTTQRVHSEPFSQPSYKLSEAPSTLQGVLCCFSGVSLLNSGRKYWHAKALCCHQNPFLLPCVPRARLNFPAFPIFLILK